MTEPARTSSEQQRQAADWFAKLNGEPAGEDWLAFTAWLEADPRHRLAYDAVEATWLDLEEVAAPPSSVVNFERRLPRPAAIWAGLTGLAAAAAVAAVLVGPMTAPAKTEVYEAQIGQPRTVQLPDGSKLALNGGAKVSVTFRRGDRLASLDRGEADFDVFHDERRPFTVAVGDSTIRVLGTQFDVIRRSQGLTVTVERGLIAVGERAGGDPVRVAAGHQLRRSGQGDLMRAVAPAEATAWRTGKLIYRDAPLKEVAEDVSRYGAVPISVEPGVANLKVTAVLKLDAEEAMVDRLESFLPIEAETSASEIRLRGAPERH